MPMSTRHRLGGLATLAVLLAGATTACGSSDSSTAAPAPQTSGSSSMSMSPSTSSGSDQSGMAGMIMIKDFSFATPKSVKAGSTVMVMNDDSEAHTVTADSGGAFDVTVQAGTTATFKAPTKPGSYPYHCNYHSNMHGTLVVR